MTEALVEVQGLTKHFPVTRGVLGRVVGQVRAVEDVSFKIFPGETVGLVGESGCGKSTVGRLLVRLLEPTAGQVKMAGALVHELRGESLRDFRRQIQIIFQDPYSSLNPRMRVFDIVGEALKVHGVAKGEALEDRVVALLEKVGVAPAWMNRFPHEFSGGQRQRIGIARAIALAPKLIVCDEAVSALDVSIQAQVLNLLMDLREELGLAYLFISHDLSVVRHISHRVAVMYLGQIVEFAAVDDLFDTPFHPYTRALLEAVPEANPRASRKRMVLKGDVPSPLNPPAGCRFHTRCPAVVRRCYDEEPDATELEGGRQVKCHHIQSAVLEHAALLGKAEAPDVSLAALVRRTVDAAVTDNQNKSDSSADTERLNAEQLWAAGGSGGRESESELSPDSRRLWLAGIGVSGLGGAALILAQWHISGALLFLLACAGASVLGAAGLRSKVLLWGCAAALGILELLSIPSGQGLRRAQARQELHFLTRQLDERKEHAGVHPQTLSELGWRVHTVFPSGELLDPWGTPYRFRAPGSEGREYDLGSAGADRIPSEDDIGQVPSRD